MSKDLDRRDVLRAIGIALLSPAASRAAEEEGEEIEAVEDLMREHGVLRRALLVYAETAARLARGQVAEIPVDPLRETAILFRSFGEDYHERSLEERHIFPVLASGKHATLANVLKQQHNRGRQITDYITSVAGRGRLTDGDAKQLGTVLTSFVRMYEHHAAIEDTVVFPAWKAAIPRTKYEDLSGQFEELEHKMFGEDGFEDAVGRIAKIEKAFGLADLSALTAPQPPKLA